MEKINPVISVIMSVYNAQNYVKSTIESILNQTWRNFEFIIIDDGSTDQSQKIIKSFKDQRIILIKNPKNIGLTKSLNKGIKIARGKYIARIDADDLALSKRLEVQLRFLEENPDCALCGSWAQVIDDQGKIIVLKKPFTHDIQIRKNLLKANLFIHSSLMIRKKILMEIKGYDEKFKLAQDYDLVLRISAQYQVKNLGQILLKYRQRPSQLSYHQMRKSLFYGLKARINALKNHQYPYWQIIYLARPLISFLIPTFFKKLFLTNHHHFIKKTPLCQQNLALFFTQGVSLKIWHKVGNLDREIKPYNHLASKFNQISFFTYGDKSDLKFQKFLAKNIKIYPRKGKMPTIIYSLLLPLIYRRELKKIDIIKTNQMNGAWAAVLAKWLYRKKLVVRCGYEFLKMSETGQDPAWKQKIIALAEKISYHWADKIILTSYDDQQFIEKRFKIDSQKIILIPNYIDTDLFRPMKIKKEKNRFIFIGRMNAQKNLFNLIKALKRLSVILIIIGEGELKDKLKKLAKRIKVKVQFRGKVANEQLPQELNKSEVFILPSLYEGCPKALLEAMSCGMPVIGTKVSGIEEIIRHRENGYLCQTKVPSIQRAIVQVMKNNILKQKLSQNSRKTILNQFSLKRILERELNLYQLL